jgi:hypothetical protein
MDAQPEAHTLSNARLNLCYTHNINTTGLV